MPLKNFIKNIINCAEWENFFANVYPPRINENIEYFDAIHPFLDQPINSNELVNLLAHCSSGKAPGFDTIPNEF